MKLDRSQAEGLLKRIQGLPVAVLGDLMLDEYLFGEVSRISPEAPVPIVRIVRERWVLGGAANVAANLKALGAEPLLVGTCRDDVAGRRLRAVLEEQGIATDGLVEDESRPTIIKTRVIGQHQQMLRIDREQVQTMPEPVLEGLRKATRWAASAGAAVIVSDYAKGVVVESVVDLVRDLCGGLKRPWIVDPKPSQKELYRGATLMTPNTKELAELAHCSVKSDEDVGAAAAALVRELGLSGLLVTRAEKGMALVSQEPEHREAWMIPTVAREVFDVSGAGDTVAAAFTAAVAAGADWKQAAMLANVAAGVVVGKVGTATVTPREVLEHFQDQEAL